MLGKTMKIRRGNVEFLPKIYWRKGKLIACKTTDNKYCLTLEKNGELYYTGIVEDKLEDVINQAEGYESRV